MINRVVLTGRLTKDVELRYISSNIAVAKFTLAVDRMFTQDNGERGTDYIQVVCWRKQAENVSKFCGKGSLVGVDGRIQTGSYDDKDGKRVYTTEVIADSVSFLEKKPQDNGMYPEQDKRQRDYNKEDNSDLPFRN